MQRGYIIELKYTTEGSAEELRKEAVQLHKIAVVCKGMEIRVCEEVE